MVRVTCFKSDLQQIRRSIHYKLKNRARLTPAEVHLLRNFAALERKFLGPSIGSIAIRVFSALMRPMIKVGCVATVALMLVGNTPAASSGAPDPAAEIALNDEYGPTEAPKEISIPDLALALASDAVDEGDDAADPEIVLPEISLLNGSDQLIHPEPAQAVTAKLSLKTESAQESEQLKRQRNLVKFLSGLIAAYRPSITDCGTIARHIVELSATENVDPFYVAAVISIESRFHSGAQSEVGAMGLMQLMPATAREVASQSSSKHVALVDPRTNIRLGISYLKQLEERYKGNRSLALAAYNWGPANVDKTGWRTNRVPSSVRKYSNTVLERTVSWQRHFAKATESANSLSAVVVAKSN